MKGRVSILAACAAVLASTSIAFAQSTKTAAPSTVAGQVTILERPGETTEDLGNVVIYLEAVASKAAVPAPLTPTNTVIQLQSRQFAPRVRIITTGSKVEFQNQDPWNHNVFSKTNGGFDTGVYGRGKSKDNTFNEAGVYPLYCNVHPRMTAFVITLATPWYTQAGADGRFSFDKVPAGQYRIHVWHDRATQLDSTITLPSAAASLKFSLDARGYKYVQHKNKLGQDYTSATGDRY